MRPDRLRLCMLVYYLCLGLLFAFILALLVLFSAGLGAWVAPALLTGAVLCWLGAAGAGALALRSLGAGWLESVGVPAVDFVLTPALLVLMFSTGFVASPSLLNAMIKGRVREKRAAIGVGEIAWGDDDSLRKMLRAWSAELIGLGYCPKCRYEIGELGRCPECGLVMSRVRWGDCP